MERLINSEIVDEWTQLLWFINTKYDIDVNWTDNGEVVKSWIVWSGQVVALQDGPKISLENLEYRFPTVEKFEMYALDQAWNEALEIVELTISVPEIAIEEIRYMWSVSEIESRLSQTIDKGRVMFQRQRNGIRENMDPNPFVIEPLNPIIVWTPYPLDEDIVIRDRSGNERATCNSQNCKITTWPNCRVKGSCRGSGKLQLEIIDTSGDRDELLYTIEPVAQSLAGDTPIEILQWWYTLVTLNDSSADHFRFGQCVRHQWNCVMYIDDVWNIYVEPIFQDRIAIDYDFDDTLWAVVLTFRDAAGIPFLRMKVIMKPF